MIGGWARNETAASTTVDELLPLTNKVHVQLLGPRERVVPGEVLDDVDNDQDDTLAGSPAYLKQVR